MKYAAAAAQPALPKSSRSRGRHRRHCTAGDRQTDCTEWWVKRERARERERDRDRERPVMYLAMSRSALARPKLLLLRRLLTLLPLRSSRCWWHKHTHTHTHTQTHKQCDMCKSQSLSTSLSLKQLTLTHSHLFCHIPVTVSSHFRSHMKQTRHAHVCLFHVSGNGNETERQQICGKINGNVIGN